MPATTFQRAVRNVRHVSEIDSGSPLSAVVGRALAALGGEEPEVVYEVDGGHVVQGDTQAVFLGDDGELAVTDMDLGESTDRYVDLLKQGFMRRALNPPKPKPKAEKKVRPIVACKDCQDWHREGKHTKSAAERKANRKAKNEAAVGVSELPAGLGVPRAQMPQIQSGLVPEFLAHLSENGVRVKRGQRKVGSLKPTQDGVTSVKAEALARTAPKDKLRLPVIVSSDGYILDGHHRWAALVSIGENERIQTYEVAVPMRKLLELARRFEKVGYKEHGEAIEDAEHVDEFLALGLPTKLLPLKGELARLVRSQRGPVSVEQARNYVATDPYVRFDPTEQEIVAALKALGGRLRGKAFVFENVPIEEEISRAQLASLERALDKIFAAAGIDVEFTKHFHERVNDPRNGKPITVEELAGIFREVWSKHRKTLESVDVDWRAIIHDTTSAINIPVVLDYDPRKGEVELVAKTVMRRKAFMAREPRLNVTSGVAERGEVDEAAERSKVPGLRFDVRKQWPGYAFKVVHVPSGLPIWGSDLTSVKLATWAGSNVVKDIRKVVKAANAHFARFDWDKPQGELDLVGAKRLAREFSLKFREEAVPQSISSVLVNEARNVDEAYAAFDHTHAPAGTSARENFPKFILTGLYDSPAVARQAGQYVRRVSVEPGVSSTREWNRMSDAQIKALYKKLGLSASGPTIGTTNTLPGQPVSEHELAVDEGVYDPFALKAVFMTGGAGSGKSFVSEKMFGGMGLKVVNSDAALERAMAKAGLDLKKDLGLEQVQREGGIRDQAKLLTSKKLDVYVKGRLGLIIDSTAATSAKVTRQVDRLRALGYDVCMVFVNTSLETALARNRARARVVPERIATADWRKIQENLKTYRTLFGPANFREVHNDEVLTPREVVSRLVPQLTRVAMSLLNRPVQNPIGKKWVADEIAAKNRQTARPGHAQRMLAASIEDEGEPLLAEALKKSKVVPGVAFETEKIGSYTYLTVRHIPSGKAIYSLTRGPIPGVRKTVAVVEKILKRMDWNVPEDQLDKKTAVRLAAEIGQKIPLDVYGNYEIRESALDEDIVLLLGGLGAVAFGGLLGALSVKAKRLVQEIRALHKRGQMSAAEQALSKMSASDREKINQLFARETRRLRNEDSFWLFPNGEHVPDRPDRVSDTRALERATQRVKKGDVNESMATDKRIAAMATRLLDRIDKLQAQYVKLEKDVRAEHEKRAKQVEAIRNAHGGVGVPDLPAAEKAKVDALWAEHDHKRAETWWDKKGDPIVQRLARLLEMATAPTFSSRWSSIYQHYFVVGGVGKLDTKQIRTDLRTLHLRPFSNEFYERVVRGRAKVGVATLAVGDHFAIDRGLETGYYVVQAITPKRTQVTARNLDTNEQIKVRGKEEVIPLSQHEATQGVRIHKAYTKRLAQIAESLDEDNMDEIWVTLSREEAAEEAELDLVEHECIVMDELAETIEYGLSLLDVDQLNTFFGLKAEEFETAVEEGDFERAELIALGLLEGLPLDEYRRMTLGSRMRRLRARRIGVTKAVRSGQTTRAELRRENRKRRMKRRRSPTMKMRAKRYLRKTRMRQARRRPLSIAKESLDEYGRRRSSGGDPRWIKAKYAGTDAKGQPFKKGEEVLYYPHGKKIYAGENAKSAWRDFLSMRGDEEGTPYAESLDEGPFDASFMLEDLNEDYEVPSDYVLTRVTSHRHRDQLRSAFGDDAISVMAWKPGQNFIVDGVEAFVVPKARFDEEVSNIGYGPGKRYTPLKRKPALMRGKYRIGVWMGTNTYRDNQWLKSRGFRRLELDESLAPIPGDQYRYNQAVKSLHKRRPTNLSHEESVRILAWDHGKGRAFIVDLLTKRAGYSEAAANALIDKVTKGDIDESYGVPSEAVDEVAPPGFEGAVKAMKKSGDVDNPYALAWWMKKRGMKSHKKESVEEASPHEAIKVGDQVVTKEGVDPSGLIGKVTKLEGNRAVVQWGRGRSSPSLHALRDLLSATKKDRSSTRGLRRLESVEEQSGDYRATIQMNIEWDGSQYTVELPQNLGPAGTWPQNVWEFDTYEEALAFAKLYEQYERFYTVVWNLSPEDTVRFSQPGTKPTAYDAESRASVQLSEDAVRVPPIGPAEDKRLRWAKTQWKERTITKVGQEVIAYVGRTAIASGLSMRDLILKLKLYGLEPRTFRRVGRWEFDTYESVEEADAYDNGRAPKGVKQFTSLNDAAVYDDAYKKGSTEIWYAIDAGIGALYMGLDHLRKYEPRAIPTAATLAKTHVRVGKIAETRPERIFGLMQGERWSPQGEARTLIRKLGLRHTSMNVGDVIKVGGKVLFVDRVGFKKLD
jgi:predicted kinase